MKCSSISAMKVAKIVQFHKRIRRKYGMFGARGFIVQ
jgi:hypothetical protein